jgi:heme A synthase
MISAIFNLVSTIISGVFHLVGGILSFVFALPLWLIFANNLIGLLIIVGIVCLIFRKTARK